MIQTSKTAALDDLARIENSPQAMASWKQAQQLIVQNRFGPAVTVYRNLVKQFPGVARLWAELGIAATGDLDFALAMQSCQRAADMAAQDRALLISIGEQFHRLRRLPEAVECFKRAVTAEPASVEAGLNLAALLEKDRRLEEAWECVEACRARNPQAGHVLYVRAFLLHRRGLNTEAETALRDLLKSIPPDPNVRSAACHLLGVIMDGLAQYPEAIRLLRESKALLRQSANTDSLLKAYDERNKAQRELLASFKPDTIKRWRDETPAGSCPHPLALLGGAPRSGTTLLEQILGAHPGIIVFDEPKSFALEVAGALVPVQPGARKLALNALNALPVSARAAYVQRYLKSILNELPEPPGRGMLLDKNPSLTASLHLWLRLFPHSKVIISLRDPRDNVLSCFFQSLPLTAVNANFLTLERAAKFYSDLMDTWLRLRDLGGFDWIQTCYEDVVGNMEGEGKRVTNFLGFQWDAQQANYPESARRKFVHAPTYHDVTKPIYTKAVRRWEHYAVELAPVQAALAPYCREFGYSET